MQETKENSKESMNLKKLDGIIKILNILPEKVPKEMRLETCGYKGSELLENGTFGIKTHYSDGAMIVTDELKPFIEYLEKCKSNGEARSIVIGLYPHSNNKKVNNGIGLCDCKDADFADISIITSEKTIKLHVNCIHPITRKIGHRVEVFDTAWKRLPDISSSPNRKKVLMERMISTMASMAEKYMNGVICSREEFIKVINSVEAIELNEVANKIKTDGELNNTGTIKVLDITNDKGALGILKTIYISYRDDKFRVNGSGAYNDMTSLGFEYGESTMEVEMSLSQIKISLTV